MTETGLYRLTDGTHLAFAASGALNPLEIADLRSTPEKMQPLVNASGGRSSAWPAEGCPRSAWSARAHSTGGSNWMGLIGGADYTVTGIRQMSLLPALAGLILGLGALMFAWRREGR